MASAPRKVPVYFFRWIIGPTLVGVAALSALYLSASGPWSRTGLETHAGPNWVVSKKAFDACKNNDCSEYLAAEAQQGFAEINRYTGVSGSGGNALRVFIDTFHSGRPQYWIAFDVRADGSAHVAFMGIDYGDENDRPRDIKPRDFDLPANETGPFLDRFDAETQTYTGSEIPRNMLFDGTHLTFERHKRGAIFSGGSPVMWGKTFARVSDDVLSILRRHLPVDTAPGRDWTFPMPSAS